MIDRGKLFERILMRVINSGKLSPELMEGLPATRWILVLTPGGVKRCLDNNTPSAYNPSGCLNGVS
jgi:hypothetical protein